MKTSLPSYVQEVKKKSYTVAKTHLTKTSYFPSHLPSSLMPPRNNQSLLMITEDKSLRKEITGEWLNVELLSIVRYVCQCLLKVWGGGWGVPWDLSCGEGGGVKGFLLLFHSKRWTILMNWDFHISSPRVGFPPGGNCFKAFIRCRVCFHGEFHSEAFAFAVS